ncbi:MAG: hypothetical protein JNN30_13795 [Rhodanobacteraceae bacterium]|nr:hypothetical protein [Rhodanobacteraceae bacterium]
MAQKHAAFWDARSIQEFWTGHSFLRPDDSNLLSYGPVERLTQPSGQDATRYAALLRNADANDGGIRARHDAFGLQAGDLAEQLPGPGPWEPTPSSGAAVEAQAVSRARELAPTLPPLDEAEDLPR